MYKGVIVGITTPHILIGGVVPSYKGSGPLFFIYSLFPSQHLWVDPRCEEGSGHLMEIIQHNFIIYLRNRISKTACIKELCFLVSL